MTRLRSVVRGCGSYLPRTTVTNDDLAARVDTSDDWIIQRTGIRQRHIAGPDETTSVLGTRAAQAALAGFRAPQHHRQCRERTRPERFGPP